MDGSARAIWPKKLETTGTDNRVRVRVSMQGNNVAEGGTTNRGRGEGCSDRYVDVRLHDCTVYSLCRPMLAVRRYETVRATNIEINKRRTKEMTKNLENVINVCRNIRNVAHETLPIIVYFACLMPDLRC